MIAEQRNLPRMSSSGGAAVSDMRSLYSGHMVGGGSSLPRLHTCLQIKKKKKKKPKQNKCILQIKMAFIYHFVMARI